MHIQKQVIGWDYNLSVTSWYSDTPSEGGSGRGGIGLLQLVLLFTSIKIWMEGVSSYSEKHDPLAKHQIGIKI